MRLALCCALALLLAHPGAARAQERPWAEGVSVAQQNEALGLFDAGNKLFEQGLYAQALTIYRQAVAAWDHPAIRYNMAVARIHLDMPLAAFEDLERALRFGSAALKPDVHAQALTYRKLLLGQLAQLKVVCREPGAQVLLDGQELMVGPGEVTRVLVPGAHQLVASKAAYVTATRALSLVAGRTAEEQIDLELMPRPTRTVRRWPSWKPWTVLYAGAGLALFAVPLQLAAASSFSSYDRAVSMICVEGCLPSSIPESVRAMRSRGRVENGVAIGLVAAGSAVAVSGLVMILMNQPRTVDAGGVTVVPTASGIVVSGRF